MFFVICQSLKLNNQPKPSLSSAGDTKISVSIVWCGQQRHKIELQNELSLMHALLQTFTQPNS